MGSMGLGWVGGGWLVGGGSLIVLYCRGSQEHGCGPATHQECLEYLAMLLVI